ncbi:hypothetical protein CAEBREN_03134 [Caenorhabditis brenneri]|uniref:F-box domain-containing protein n=1 Tax=Caenorhabditis brenneri TaxID=135651 RepID=G0MMH9_CAEBE|nr:hypothetical protein CAEBREN_03134 [Caenorhabditis brenneri]
MPLPLLRIPDVALKYIANHMSKVELIKISLCSRKADRVLKRCGQKELSYFKVDKYSLNKLEHLELSLLEAGRAEGGVCAAFRLVLVVNIYNSSVRIDVSYNDSYVYALHFECLNKLDQFAGIQKSLMMKDTYIPVVMTADKSAYTFWNNRADGLIFLLKCLNERFRDVTHELRIFRGVMPDTSQCLRKFVDYTSLPEVSLIRVSIEQGVQVPIEDFRYILEYVKFDQSSVLCEFSSCFKVNENFKFHSTVLCSKLFLYSGHWISLQYLLQCKHRKIMVAGSKFTNEEIRIYMEQWVAGTIPDVQKIYVDMVEPYKVDYVLSGLQRCGLRCSWRDIHSDRVYEFIKGVGNKVAIVRKDWFKMEVHTDWNAVNVEDDDEQSDGSEEIEDNKGEDGEEEEDEEGSNQDEDSEESEEGEDEAQEESDLEEDMEDEEEEKSDWDENMEEDEEESEID